MKTKLFFSFLLFHVALMAGAQGASRGKVLPEWMKQSFVDSNWGGVSPPTLDKNKGRSVALINAALGYLRSQHTGNIQCGASIEMSSEQSDDKEEYSEEYNEAAIVTYTGFSCKVTDEYCNGRGEYFVECCFVKDETNMRDSLIICKDYANKIVNGVSVATVKTNLMLKMGGEIYASKLSCNAKNGEVPVFQLSVDNVPFEQVKNLKYEKIRWNSDIPKGALVISDAELGQSLGIAQMAVCSLLPFVPSTIKCMGRSMLDEYSDGDKNFTNFIVASTLTANSSSIPVKTSPLLLSNRGFVLNVHNTNFDDVDIKQINSNLFGSYDEKSKTILALKPLFDENDKDGAFWRLIRMENELLSSISFSARLLGENASKRISRIKNDMPKDDLMDDSSNRYEDYSSKYNQELCNIGVKWDFGNISRVMMEKTYSGKLSRNWNDIRGIWIKVGTK